MKSCPVVFAMRAISPERPSRTSMPSATSPARMRSRAGLRNSTDGICLLPQIVARMERSGMRDPGLRRCAPPSGLRPIALGLAGFEGGDQMIEAVAGALELGGEVAPVVGVDRRVERQPP